LVSNTAANKSIKNGFTRRQHFAAVSDIDNLFRNSTRIETRPDRNGDANIVALHRFAAPLFEDNVAYITVKESVEHGKKIYTVELIEMERLGGEMKETDLKASFTTRTQPSPLS
jgi:hypothetical protein